MGDTTKLFVEAMNEQYPALNWLDNNVWVMAILFCIIIPAILAIVLYTQVHIPQRNRLREEENER